MSDGDSIAGSVTDSLKDLGKEAIKQVAGSASSSVKTATQQVTGFKTEEEEAKQKEEQIKTHARIKQIEVEMAQIRAENEKKEGPEIQKRESQSFEEAQAKNSQKVDEASRQAIGKAEQGRNFKG
jgi:hypothetical protein